MVLQEMSFEDFQDGCNGCHLGYLNGTKLANLDLHIALIPATKFQFNLSYGYGEEAVRRNSRWLPCLFMLMCYMNYIPVNNISVMSGQFPVFLGCTSTKQRIKLFLKDTMQCLL